MKNIFKLLVTSVLAGFMIGFGCISYATVENHILGAFLFSLGLLTVVIQGYTLYTGKIGYTTFKEWFTYLLPIIIGNLIGIFGLCYLFANFSTISIDANSIVAAKCSESWLDALIRSIGCGVMMYIAVDSYAEYKNPLCIILPVMAFILCGFDHCIANYGYLAMEGKIFTPQLPIWILGNSIGSILFYRLGLYRE